MSKIHTTIGIYSNGEVTVDWWELEESFIENYCEDLEYEVNIKAEIKCK